MKKSVLKSICSWVAAAMLASCASPALAFFSEAIPDYQPEEYHDSASGAPYLLYWGVEDDFYWHSKRYGDHEPQWQEMTKAPTYYEAGMKTTRCLTCGYTRYETLPQLEYNPNNPQGAGRVYFNVVNAQTKVRIGGANLSFVSETGKAYSVNSGAGNERNFIILPVGKYRVTVTYRDNIPRSFNITVKEGDQTLPDIGLSTEPLVEGKFSCKVMTLDEIKSAGIDTTNPANQHVFNYKIVFDFIPDDYGLGFYFNSAGEYVGYSGVSHDSGNQRLPDGYEIKYHGSGSGGSSAPHVSIYNPATGDSKDIYPVMSIFI